MFIGASFVDQPLKPSVKLCHVMMYSIYLLSTQIVGADFLFKTILQKIILTSIECVSGIIKKDYYAGISEVWEEVRDLGHWLLYTSIETPSK